MELKRVLENNFDKTVKLACFLWVYFSTYMYVNTFYFIAKLKLNSFQLYYENFKLN